MLIRPRLTDHHGIAVAQTDVSFAIPFLDEDIPLYVDPFLLWRSPSQQDQMFHTGLINAFNNLGRLAAEGKENEAIRNLVAASECDEVGLGVSATRKGKRIGVDKAEEIISLFRRIPQYGNRGFRHFEEIQFYVDGISRDRVSDIACSFLKSVLIDYTIDQCMAHGIPLQNVDVENVYDYRNNTFSTARNLSLPVSPESGLPILLVPKRWLRFVPWINYDDYFAKHCPQDDISHQAEELTRVNVLSYNRDHYGVVEDYITFKERTSEDCKNDPLFSQIPVTSARRKLNAIKALDTGKGDGADRKYEDAIGSLLPSLLYPRLDFAQTQARTESGVSIRDLIFYNTRSGAFLSEMFDDYGSRQITFELKNVARVEREHVDQINRYLSHELGRFGVLVTRHPLRAAEFKRTVDLWSGQRKAVVALTDADIAQMVEVFESKQREPLDVLVKKYAEFRRACP